MATAMDAAGRLASHSSKHQSGKLEDIFVLLLALYQHQSWNERKSPVNYEWAFPSSTKQSTPTRLVGLWYALQDAAAARSRPTTYRNGTRS